MCATRRKMHLTEVRVERGRVTQQRKGLTMGKGMEAALLSIQAGYNFGSQQARRWNGEVEKCLCGEGTEDLDHTFW